MKYVLYLMLFLVVFSLPLSYFGYYVSPSFSTSLNYFADFIDRTDTFAFEVLEFFGETKQSGLKGKSYVYTFDPDNPFDVILSNTDQFKDVSYCVVIPKNIRDSYSIFAEIGSKIYPKATDAGKTFPGYDYRKMTFVVAFDRYGNYLHYFGFYNGQTTLEYSDHFKDSFFMKHVDKMILDLPKERYNPFNNGQDAVISVTSQGSFIDLVNKYLK